MNQERVARLTRIVRVESAKANQLRADLASLSAEVGEAEKVLTRMKERISDALVEKDFTGATLDKCQQISSRVVRAGKSVTNHETTIANLEQHRDQLIERLTGQRATIKGWNLLIDRLKREDAETLAQRETVVADEAFLAKNNGVTR